MSLRSRVSALEGEVEELSRQLGRLRLAADLAQGRAGQAETRLDELTQALWAAYRRGKAGDLEALLAKIEQL